MTVMLVEADPKTAPLMGKDLQKLGDNGLRVAVQSTQPWLSDDDSPRCVSWNPTRVVR